MTSVRRQLTLFVREPERSPLEAVRQRLDPRQHALIAAHVTLCREDELAPWPPLREALLALTGVDVEVALGRPEQRADGCVWLPAAGASESFHALRRRLLGESCRRPVPHVTLLHPRHAAGVSPDLDALAREPLPASLRLTEIALIEQVDGGVWRVLERFGGARV